MRAFFATLFLALSLFVPTALFAAEEKFFEFASDVGVPIEVPTSSVAIQDFKIYNDFIDAVDLWYDNTGSSGSVTIALLTLSNTVLESRTVTVPHADPFYTGQRLHVTFTDTTGVESGTWYRLRITSNTSKLRLYGIQRIQFIEHNAPTYISDAIGGSTVNGDSQLVAFKFALYEEIDTDGPIITNASSTIAGTDTVRIAFNASELADRMVAYTVIGSGVVSTVNYTGNYSVCFEGISLCTVTIDTQRDTLYTYRLSVRDSWGNESYVDGAFESWKPGAPTPPADPTTPPVTPPSETPPPSTEPPVIPLVISNARVVSVTESSVQLSWNTDRAANSTLVISTDPIGSQVASTATDGTYELVHTISTGKGIATGADYYATLISRDESGVMAAQVIPFTSLSGASAPAQPEVPASSPPALQAVISQDSGTASVAWGAPAGGEPSDGYRVDIIDAQGNLIETRFIPAGTHTTEFAGLTGGEYRVVAYADDKGVVEKVAQPAAISIKKKSEPIDTYELIKKPIVYVPSILFVMLIIGLYIYDKRQKRLLMKKK